MNYKRYLIIGLSILTGIAAFFGMRGCDKKKDIVNSTQALRSNEDEAVIVDPVKHNLIIITKTRTKTLTLPDRPSRIALMTGDGLKIESPQYGTEMRPFAGVGYSLNGGVVSFGVDVAYYKRCDLGLGLIVNPVEVKDTEIFVGVSTYIYSNTSLGLGLSNQKTPLLFLKVRL